MANRIITLDIDAVGIRLLQTREDRIERWATAPLEPGLLSDGIVRNPEALAAQVQQLMTSSGMKKGIVISSLSGLYSVSRLLNVPDPRGAVGSQRLAQIAQEAVPGNEMRLQYQLVPRNAAGDRAFVQGCPSELVEPYVSMLRTAGLAPTVLEMKGVALARAAGRSNALIAKR